MPLFLDKSFFPFLECCFNSLTSLFTNICWLHLIGKKSWKWMACNSSQDSFINHLKTREFDPPPSKSRCPLQAQNNPASISPCQASLFLRHFRGRICVHVIPSLSFHGCQNQISHREWIVYVFSPPKTQLQSPHDWRIGCFPLSYILVQWKWPLITRS